MGSWNGVQRLETVARQCSLGSGNCAARCVMNSSGDITRSVMPTRHGVLSLNTTCPAALRFTRSLASAGA